MSGSDDMGAMNRYVTLQPLGDGTYGSVMLGQRVDTGEKVMNMMMINIFRNKANSKQFNSFFMVSLILAGLARRVLV